MGETSPFGGAFDEEVDASATSDTADTSAEGEAPADEASTDVAPAEAAQEGTSDPAKTQEAAPKEQQQEDTTPDFEVPENLKAAFKKHPELKAAYYFSKHVMPVTEAKEYKNLFPGGLQDAKTAIATRDSLARYEQMAYENPQAFVGELEKATGQAFDGFLSATIAHPKVQAHMHEHTKGALQNALLRFAELAKQDGTNDPDAEAAARYVEARYGLSGKQPRNDQRDPLENDPRLQRLQELERAQQAQYQEQSQRLLHTVHGGFKDRVEKAARALVDQKGVAFSEAARTRIMNEIVEEVGKVFGANQANAHAVRGMLAGLASGTGSHNSPDAIADAMLERARYNLNDITQKVLKTWSDDLMGANKAQREAAKPKPKPAVLEQPTPKVPQRRQSMGDTLFGGL